jgi:hypothetical protein
MAHHALDHAGSSDVLARWSCDLVLERRPRIDRGLDVASANRRLSLAIVVLISFPPFTKTTPLL